MAPLYRWGSRATKVLRGSCESAYRTESTIRSLVASQSCGEGRSDIVTAKVKKKDFCCIGLGDVDLRMLTEATGTPASVLSKAKFQTAPRPTPLQDPWVSAILWLERKHFWKCYIKRDLAMGGQKREGRQKNPAATMTSGELNGSVRGTPRSWLQELSGCDRPEGKWEARGHYININLHQAQRQGARPRGAGPEAENTGREHLS